MSGTRDIDNDSADVVVLRGAPDDVELAALHAAIAQLRARSGQRSPRPAATWTRPVRYRAAGAWNGR